MTPKLVGPLPQAARIQAEDAARSARCLPFPAPGRAASRRARRRRRTTAWTSTRRGATAGMEIKMPESRPVTYPPTMPASRLPSRPRSTASYVAGLSTRNSDARLHIAPQQHQRQLDALHQSAVLAHQHPLERAEPRQDARQRRGHRQPQQQGQPVVGVPAWRRLADHYNESKVPRCLSQCLSAK